MQDRKKFPELIWQDENWVVCALACLLLTATTPTSAFELVTRAEAALPAAPHTALELRGSPTRRPNVTVVSPPPNAGQMHSPLDLKLQFQAFGGAAVNPDSVVVTYLKQPAIDITQRIKPFITKDGISIPQADVPPGKHQFWIELKDKDGRIGGAEFSFQIAQ